MPGRIARFGTFEADLDAEELRRAGRLVRIQHQPFEVLRALVEHPGELVTREALHAWLWPDGVNVDFDQSLNKSITKLRDALGDSAENPRFVETLPKRGYRFIAPVVVGPAEAAVPRAAEVPGSGAAPPGAAGRGPAQAGGRRGRVAAAAGLVVLALGAVALVVRDHSVKAPASPAGPRAERSARAGLSPIYAAEDAYRRGRLALARQTPAALALAIEHFELATGLSPAYAEAWAGLADALALRAMEASTPPRAALARARDAANRALSLSPALAGAHATLGQASIYLDGDWSTARWHFEKALTIDAGDPAVRRAYALALAARGERPSAERQARAGLSAAPLAPAASDALGYVLFLAGRQAEADQHLTRALT
ncbi:MAG: winged helix-turn-helix domain-containing protein, partial [Vicinamibacterales bacterium]